VPIAVKLLKKKKQDKAAVQQFMDEVAAISATNHVNLVKLFGFCCDHPTVALVFEYMENGSLDKYLFRDSSTTVDWDQLYKVAIGTARGIAYLHEESQPTIIHYDIKPANILLDDNFTPKVADFGLAKLCNEDGTHADVREYRGTPGYSAPEFVTKKSAVTNKCDVYSFGMVLFEIVGRRRNAQSDSGNSLDWFPKRVWDMYESGGLEEFVVGYCGFKEKDRKQVERAGVTALWCVQSSGEARPKMSDVVKMLEGEVEIMQPPKPFNYNAIFSTTPTPNHYSTTSTSDYDETNSYSRAN
jgi:serine/threonine protein kinase